MAMAIIDAADVDCGTRPGGFGGKTDVKPTSLYSCEIAAQARRVALDMARASGRALPLLLRVISYAYYEGAIQTIFKCVYIGKSGTVPLNRADPVGIQKINE